MTKKITLILFMLFLCSCIKKSSSQNSESQIVDLLNQNQADSALLKIDQELKENPTDELLYLKASALSMKAGVDVYALFPLLKVKIFDVAISQWSQNREFQRKANEHKSEIIFNSDELKEQNDGGTNKGYRPLTDNELNYKILYLDKYYYSNTQEGPCQLSMEINPTNKKIELGILWFVTELHSKKDCDDLNTKDIVDQYAENLNVLIPSLLDSQIKEYISRIYQFRWEQHGKDIAKKAGYVKMLGTAWTLIDLIPTLNKIPKLKTEDFETLKVAQDLLSQIKIKHVDKKDSLGEKARKQLIMLSALKMAAHFQNAFELSHIKSPNDFICLSNENAASELNESESDALYILNAIEDPEIIKKNQALFDDIKSKYQSIVQEEIDNPVVKENHISKILNELESAKKTYCE